MIERQLSKESNDSFTENSSKLKESKDKTEFGNNNKLKIMNGLLEESECPVCINTIEERAFTDSCLHQFCRQCIEKWSQNHNKCPICRQTYTSIVCVVSDTEYKRIPLNRLFKNSQTGMLLVDENIGLLFTPLDSGVYMITTRETPHGIQQNILFLASNQTFILENMGTNVTFVRPEELDYVLSDLDELGAVQQVYHNTHAIPVLRENQRRGDTYQFNNEL